MANPLFTAISLAGFLFAQVSSVVTEVSDRDVAPVAFVISGDEQKFTFFSGKTLQEMVENGRKELKNPKYDAWSLAYEGFVTLNGNRQEALLLEGWARGAHEPVLIAQPWKRTADHKAPTLIGGPLMLKYESAPHAGASQVTVPTALDEQGRKAFQDGIAQLQSLRKQNVIGTPKAASPPH